MTLESRDRFHAKQGRSTARVVLKRADRPLAVYLKRHFQLPGFARLEPFRPWRQAFARRRGMVASRARPGAGDRCARSRRRRRTHRPAGHLKSFLMIAELTGCEAVNELLPRLAVELDAPAFGTLKRRLIAEMARITATLHAARVFHKDLYLCHFFLDHDRLDRRAQGPSRSA